MGYLESCSSKNGEISVSNRILFPLLSLVILVGLACRVRIEESKVQADLKQWVAFDRRQAKSPRLSVRLRIE